MPDKPRLIGTTQAAQRLGVDRATVTRMVADGRLAPAGKLPHRNGAFLFDPRDVDKLAAAS